MPSEKVLAQKQTKVSELTELLKGAVSGVFVDYKGINVEDDTKLRKELREAGVHYAVEKNTMLTFALKNVGINIPEDVFKGSTAIAISTGDQTAPARILGSFGEKFKGEKFVMKAGFIGSEVYDNKGVMALSKIPSKDVLLSQLVGALQGPITGLACIIKAVADSKSEDAA